MDIKNLNTFIQVAELSSFTQAAEQLGYSQSTVSFQIRQLETELGVSLFDRINHTIALTEKGREMLQYAHQMVRLNREMGRAAKEQEQVKGLVRVASADSLCSWLLGERFAALHTDYPGITLQIIPADTEEMFRLLGRNQVDLVITLDQHLYSREYVMMDEEQIAVHFVAAAQSPLAGRRLTMDQLVTQPFLLTEKGMSYRRLMDEQLARANLEVSPILESGNTDLLRRLAEQGMGLAFLPDYVTQASVEQGRLCRLEVEGLQVEVWKQMLYHRDKWVSPQMKIFMDYFTTANGGRMGGK